MSSDYSHDNNAVSDALKSSYLGSSGASAGYQKRATTGYQLSAGMTYQVPKTWELKPEKTDASICYIIATWSGPRRAGNQAHYINPIYYLENHFSKLNSLKFSLDKIILVAPNNPDESPKFTDYVISLPEEINGTPVELLRRENVGQSYGSWSDAFNQNPNYDYYIFIEDDYVPVIDDFDEILIQMFNHCDDCGYLCSYAHNRPPEGAHAAISNGITSNSVLHKMVHALGRIPFGGEITKTVEYSSEPQLEFSRGFLRIHTRIYDYLSYYNAPFNEAGRLVMYGPSNLPTLIAPIQFLG